MEAKQIEERFWSKVEKSEDCWEWTGPKNNKGYGKFYFDGGGVYAHRFSLALDGAYVPNGLCVCHHCDNPLCVRPDHLWVGTQKENLQDMTNKGRRKPRSHIGERNPNVKLTEADVSVIKGSLIPQVKLAKLFGVTRQLISEICRGNLWSHVK